MIKINLGKDVYIKGRIGWRGLNKNEYLEKSNYRIINATALMDGFVDWDKCGYISKERFEESSEIMLQEGDILISKDGTLGKIGYVKNINFPCTVASGIFVLRNIHKEYIDFDYIYHLLKSSVFKDFIRRNKADGSTINHLYQRDLENFEIELPEIEYQRKVSDILNTLDEIIDKNKKINIKIDSFLNDIYSYWFLQFNFPNKNGMPYNENGGSFITTEEGRMIPKDFSFKSLSEFCDIFTGHKDVNQALDVGKYKFYSCAPGFRYSNEKLYDGKAILISGNGSYTGRTIFVNDAFDLYQRTYACVPKNNNILEYIFYSLKFQFIPRVSGGTHGSAIPYIVYDDIAKEKILFNQNIINKFTEISRPLMELYVANDKKILEIENLKSVLLPMLMNGQVIINE